MKHSSLAQRQAPELARFLGWFSIGLGAVELLAGRSVSRWLAIEESEDLLRGYGVRELATGAGLIASKQPTPWVWGRVAGDVLDIVTLAAGLGRSRAKRALSPLPVRRPSTSSRRRRHDPAFRAESSAPGARREISACRMTFAQRSCCGRSAGAERRAARVTSRGPTEGHER